jgi:hypothetical protein
MRALRIDNFSGAGTSRINPYRLQVVPLQISHCLVRSALKSSQKSCRVAAEATFMRCSSTEIMRDCSSRIANRQSPDAHCPFNFAGRELKLQLSVEVDSAQGCSSKTTLSSTD